MVYRYPTKVGLYLLLVTYMSEMMPFVTEPANVPSMNIDVSSVDVNFFSQTRSNYRINQS